MISIFEHSMRDGADLIDVLSHELRLASDELKTQKDRSLNGTEVEKALALFSLAHINARVNSIVRVAMAAGVASTLDTARDILEQLAFANGLIEDDFASSSGIKKRRANAEQTLGKLFSDAMRSQELEQKLKSEGHESR